MTKEQATTQLMSHLTINSESPSSNAISSSHLSLTQLPLEIKQNIIYWLDRIASETDPFSDDGSDIEEVDDQEFNKSEPIPKSKQETTQSRLSSNSPSTAPYPDQDKPDPELKAYINPIHALSLVDRTFYELCRPLIWQDIDLEGYNLTKLKKFKSQLLVRQAEYVKSLWWRASKSELEEYEPEGWADETKKSEWDDELRSIELLDILESCHKLNNIDIDLFGPTTTDFLDKEGNFIKQDFTTWKFVQPVSELINLTSIALTAAGEKPFQELFLVRLIRDMHHLESFTCCLVGASAPNFETSKSISTCQSPLALHLASLTSLKAIDLAQVECLDLSWSTIEWRGRIESIILDDCSRATLQTIQQFSMKFSSSLIHLELTDSPCDQEVLILKVKEMNSNKHRIELPKLKFLSISNDLPIDFLRFFEDSKEIEAIELGINSHWTPRDIESLVIINPYDGSGFSKLKNVVISLGDSGITMGEIEALEVFYLSKGVALEFDHDDDDDDDDDGDYEEDDDDEDDSDDEVDSVDYQLGIEMENDWEEDQEDDDIDDDGVEY